MVIDVGQMASSLAPIVAPALPFLLGLGGKVAKRAAEELEEKVGEKAAQALGTLWGKIWPKVRKRPDDVAHVQDAAFSPEDEQSIKELTGVLSRVLEEDGRLARDARQVISHVSAFTASSRGVSAQSISDSVVTTGDSNVLQHGQSNVSIGNARDVSIGGSLSEKKH